MRGRALPAVARARRWCGVSANTLNNRSNRTMVDRKRGNLPLMDEQSKTGFGHPVPAVGVVVVHDQCVLLVQRRKPPYLGLWTLPGGKIRWGESMRAAAEREIWEETGIVVKAEFALDAIEIVDEGNAVPAFHYVVIDIRARYVSGELVARDDALAASWFSESEWRGLQLDLKTKALLGRLGSADAERLLFNNIGPLP